MTQANGASQLAARIISEQGYVIVAETVSVSLGARRFVLSGEEMLPVVVTAESSREEWQAQREAFGMTGEDPNEPPYKYFYRIEPRAH